MGIRCECSSAGGPSGAAGQFGVAQLDLVGGGEEDAEPMTSALPGNLCRELAPCLPPTREKRRRGQMRALESLDALPLVCLSASPGDTGPCCHLSFGRSRW